MASKKPGTSTTPGGGFYDHGVPFRSPGGPIAQKFDREPLYQNEPHTVPGPLSKEIRGHWARRAHPLSWVAGTPPVVATAGVSSPVFDLRPDLRGSDGFQPEGVAIRRSSAYGSGGRLMFQFHPLGGFDAITQTLRVYAVESGHIVDPQKVAGLHKPQDVSEQWWDGGVDQVMEFSPPGNPIRFWKVTVFFEMLTDVLANAPRILVSGALY